MTAKIEIDELDLESVLSVVAQIPVGETGEGKGLTITRNSDTNFDIVINDERIPERRTLIDDLRDYRVLIK
nr:MAG TPA: hypothetical protein [Caudoviricetes sp.]